MTDYKKLYFHLFNSITDAIYILQKAQQEAEGCILESDDTPILTLIENGEQIQ